jgi:hypothetical protein
LLRSGLLRSGVDLLRSGSGVLPAAGSGLLPGPGFELLRSGLVRLPRRLPEPSVPPA